MSHTPTPWMRHSDGGLWHVAIQQEIRGDKTGTLLHTFYKTACNGKTLYSPYGKPTIDFRVPNAPCKRCAALAKVAA
jgi:hypothetical protein